MMQCLNRFRSIPMVYPVAALMSLLLTAWINYIDVVINPDAICYLNSAKEFAEHGLKAAMTICPQAKWPFYSMLIYGASAFLHIPELWAAHFVDALCTMMSVLAFIYIVKKMGATGKTLWFAAFVILFVHEFNSVRQYIVRDHGYWAFYLISIICLIRYQVTSSWRAVLAWTASLTLATLFRIEAVMFMLFVPILLFFNRLDVGASEQMGFVRRVGQQAKFAIKLYVPLIVIAVLGLLWLMMHGDAISTKLGRLTEVYVQISRGAHNMLWRYDLTREALAKYVLPPESARDAGLLWFGAILVSYVLNSIGNMFWVCALLVIYAWRKAAVPFRHPVARILVVYLLINIVITASFYMQHLFLAKRYLIGQSLIFWMWVPFGLALLSQKAKGEYSRLVFYLSILLIFSSSIGVLTGRGPSKDYVKIGGEWLSQNMTHDKRFYTNDYQVMYYSNYYGRDIFKAQHQNPSIDSVLKRIDDYDVLAIKIDHHDREKLQQRLAKTKLIQVQKFSNSRGDSLVVYRHPQRSV